MTDSNQAESFCVDGDIKYTAGNIAAATASYLQGHILDSCSVKEHVTTFTEEQRSESVEILQDWLKPKEQSTTDKSKLGVQATPDQIWEFIFCLEPEAVTTCFARIEPLLREKRYQQVIDSCTAILKQYPQDTPPILLQRALARTLLGGREKEAISDYLRAYLKDKDITMQVVRNKQGDHLDSIKKLMQNCVFSKPTSASETKAHKQWLALTVDCCRFLLTFDPNDFRLQMTFTERLKAMHKIDRALAMLTETIEVLHLDLKPDPAKLTEALLRRSECQIVKQQVDQAISDITAGLNAASDIALSQKGPDSSTSSNEIDVIYSEKEKTLSIAKDIFGSKTNDILELYMLLDKSASKLSAEDRFKTVTKMDNIRNSADLYRAMLVLQPSSKDAQFKLASCYAKLGKNKLAVKIYDKLLEDTHFSQDTAILTARALCYRELGNKAEAQKDYDALLRNNPRDVCLLCERAMMYMEDGNNAALVQDLMAACKISQKLVVTQMSKEPLVQRTRTRQILFDHAKSLLQDAPLPQDKAPRTDDISLEEVIIKHKDSSLAVALSLSQLLTKLNPADQSAHILMAHAMFHAGCTNDAETKLKKMLQDHPQALDLHVIKLHLGLMKIFTKRIDEGMSALIEVLSTKGDRVVSSLLRDIPISERASLSDESHHYGIDSLHKERDPATVRRAVECFTLAILCCRGTDLVLEENSTSLWLLLTDAKCLVGIHRKSDKMSNSAWSLASSVSYNSFVIPPLKFRFEPSEIFHLQKLKRRRLNGGTGVYRSYIARAECMAHLGDQRAAVLDFSAAIEVNPLCVEGLCGRAFMRLALGEEYDCVNDVTSACELDIYAVTDHILGLPDEAKKLLLFWIDHRVVVLLLNYGYKSGSTDRLNTGGSASTVSMLDETLNKPGEDVSRTSSLSSIHLPSPLPNDGSQSLAPPTDRNVDDITPTNIASNSADDQQDTDDSLEVSDPLNPNKKRLHKSAASKRDLKEALIALENTYVHDQDGENNPVVSRHTSRGSTATTATSVSTYDDIISGMEKAEILQKSMGLGKLLITVDNSNPTWHGMYADILIVKGEFDEALRHLQLVMDLSPNDVTAVARAGLINVKMNRFRTASALLSSLADVDKNGLLYVLKAIDSSRRRKLAEETIKQAEASISADKYAEARSYYSLSLLTDPSSKIDKLRRRSRCLLKMGENSKAIVDISEVIKETTTRPQVNDYCVRGNLYLATGKEFLACKDFMKAIELERHQAISLIHVKPGRTVLCSIFYQQAVEAFSKHDYQECHDICEMGLVIDGDDIEMRKLRARAKREISKCILQ
ncbi:uncharacterized protein LOC100176663 isoform X1 [Ciona intestinalis]